MTYKRALLEPKKIKEMYPVSASGKEAKEQNK